MANLSLGEKIQQIRKGLKLNQSDFAKKLGFKYPTAVSKYEDNSRIPGKDQLIKIAELGNISLDELLSGEKFDAHKSKPLHTQSFADPPRHPAAAFIPVPDFNPPPGVDPAIQAMSDIKEIFASGDPILIPAIQANLHAFKRALLRERQFEQILRENEELKQRILKLEALCAELKDKFELLQAENRKLMQENNRLKATHGDPDGDDGTVTATEKKAM